LFGLQTNTSRVFGPTAAAIASRSWRNSPSSGTVRRTAPPICVTIGYASNDRQAHRTSSVVSRQVELTSCWHRLTEPQPTAIRSGATSQNAERRSVSVTAAKSG
jgi:hypothetical protein